MPTIAKTNRRVTTTRGSDGRQSVVEGNKAVTDLASVVERLNQFLTRETQNQVMPGAVAGLSVDASAQDIETDNTIYIRIKGIIYKIAAIAAMDISALSAGGATLATSKYGVLWVFLNGAGTADVEVDSDAQAYSSAIAAWAAWLNSANTMPPLGTAQVCIGAVLILEGGSGLYTWGTDSITTETELYFDFFGLPGVEVAVATLALDAAAATWSYGAGTVRLGDGSRIALTGKTGVALPGSNVADGAVGAWLLYTLADDVELAVQIDNDYTSLALAQAAIRDHKPNPMLPVIGYLTIENESRAAFVPGTTNLDAAGITATFTKCGPGTAQQEIGRGAVGQPYSALSSTAGHVATQRGTVIDDTV